MTILAVITFLYFVFVIVNVFAFRVASFVFGPIGIIATIAQSNKFIAYDLIAMILYLAIFMRLIFGPYKRERTKYQPLMHMIFSAILLSFYLKDIPFLQ